MKTKLLLLFLFLTITLQAQTNLVPNGDFENWTSSSQPDKWFRSFSGLVFQSTSAQNGSSSTKMQITSGTFNFINSEFFPVVAGKTYRITMYHKLVTGTFSAIDLSLYHQPGTFKTEIAKKTDAVTSSTEWRKIEFDYTPTISESIEVDIWTTGTLNSEILVDNVSVIDVAEPVQQYTIIPDVNFEKKLIALGHDSGIPDGKVLTDKINKVTNLYMPLSNISDLTGIQDFVGLKSLNCSNNQLTNLDVTKNVALTELICSSNKLTNLNLSNNLALINLYCSYNQLTNLDITKNVALKKLSCEVNQLTSLDVTKNFAITDLSCRSNKLTSLDLLSNTALVKLDCEFNSLTNIDLSKNIALEYLFCETNALTILDVSKNIALKNLDFDNNNIKELNLSNNKELTNLSGNRNKLISLNLTQNTKLVSVWVLSNELKTLDVSENTLLKDLNIQRNNLTTLDLSKNSELTTLYLNDNSVSTLDVSKNINLRTLYAERNNISYLDISKNVLLASVNLNNNKIESLDFSKNTLLKDITLDYNRNLNNLNLKNGNNTQITTLKLNGNINLTCVSVDNKIYSDEKWNSFKESWTNFSEDCRAFTTIPDSNFEKKLIALGIDLDGENGKVLTSSIAQVKTLDVSNSVIVNLMGIQDFAKLETLNCKNNELLYLDLSQNTFLNSINCSNNKLISLDLKNGKNSLIDKNTSSFINNSSLICIQVDDENYSNTNWSSLKDTASKYNTLCNSFVSIPDSNFEDKLISLGIDKDGKNARVLASSIASITTLEVSSSKISDLSGIQGFIALKELNCSSNNLKRIELEKNTSLTSLNVSANQLLNLDLSKNNLLENLICASNNLFSLNLKNGNNAKMQNMSSGNFKNNPSLTCIQVDDIAFSNSNWSDAKETTASYSTSCVENTFTLIPDANFENELIKKGFDKDGFNGGVLTSSINKLKELSITRPSNFVTDAIQDLTGIQDFVALEKLEVNYNYVSKIDLSKNVLLKNLNLEGNRLSELDLSKNVLLNKINVGYNRLTQIDLTKNASLIELNCANNKLISLDFSFNPQLNYLYSRENKLNNLNLTKNPRIYYLNCDFNELTTLDVSNNLSLQYFFCAKNKLKDLSVTKNLSLSQFGCDGNLLTNIDVSKNVNLSSFTCGGNQLTTLDVSKNLLLGSLYCYSNQLTKLDLTNNLSLFTLFCYSNQLTYLNVSRNKKLEILNCNDNNLTNLNIKNGNNLKFNSQYTDFTKNTNLTCIQVDDVEYSNSNWKLLKDVTAFYSLACGAAIELPSNNFVIETKGESCFNSNNGEINITSSSNYTFEAKINTTIYPFTNNSLKVSNLAPGTYTVIITIPGETFEQIFTIVIPKGATITGKSSLASEKVAVEIATGTAPYTVFLNGVEQFETNATSFTVDAKTGGLLEVKTAKACEGIYAKDIATLTGTISAFPNPTSGAFEIEIPATNKEVSISIYALDGQLISNKIYTVENGKVQLSLDNQPAGIYMTKVEFDRPVYVKIIKK